MVVPYSIYNLEEGKPTVDQALRALQMVLQNAGKGAVLKLIHGFGSTGKGGKIRVAVRNQLQSLQDSGRIQYYIPGESLSIFDENTRRTLDVCPTLRQDADLERHNNGITIVRLR